MKRIKYTKSFDKNDNRLLSEELLTNNNVARIFLDVNNLTFTINELRTLENGVMEGHKVSEGSAVSLQMLKKKAKQSAIDLGVTFEAEFRPRVNRN